MESQLRNTFDLLGHIDKLERQLLSRYLNLISLARIPQVNRNQEDYNGELTADRNQAAANTLKLEVESVGLVRAAEDILTLTRQMKELWLFGQLHPLHRMNKDNGTTYDDAGVVGRMLGDLAERLAKKGQS